MTEKSQQLSNMWRQCAGVCSLMLLHRLLKFLWKYQFHSDEIQWCWLLYKQCFTMSSRAHNMDNRFPPAEREAWIILFIVNTGKAWNHTQRSMQELLFQLQPKYVHGGFPFSQHSTVCSPQNMFLPIYCYYWNKAVDYFNL